MFLDGFLVGFFRKARFTNILNTQSCLHNVSSNVNDFDVNNIFCGPDTCYQPDLPDCVEPALCEPLLPLCERCRLPSTMICSRCQHAGGGLCIIFCYDVWELLCDPCRVLHKSEAARSSQIIDQMSATCADDGNAD